MALRTCFSIPAGGRYTHSLEWPVSGNEADGGGQKTFGAPRSLHWNAVVLGGLTIDLEVSVQLRPPATGSSEADLEGVFEPGPLLQLERQARGGTFVGRLRPERDKRILSRGQGKTLATSEKSTCPTVSAVVFSFSNRFSWLATKDLELITLFDWPPAPQSNVAGELHEPSLVSSQPERKQAPALETLSRPGRAPDLFACGDARLEDKAGNRALSGFAAQLAGWIENTAVAAPEDGGPWVTSLQQHLSELRTLCLEGPPASESVVHEAAESVDELAEDISAEVAEDAGEDAGEEEAAESAGEELAESAGEEAEEDCVDESEATLATAAAVAADECGSALEGDDAGDSAAQEEAARKARARQKAQQFGMYTIAK